MSPTIITISNSPAAACSCMENLSWPNNREETELDWIASEWIKSNTRLLLHLNLLRVALKNSGVKENPPGGLKFAGYPCMCKRKRA